MSYRAGVRLALQGEPTHRFFLPAQLSALASLACQSDSSAPALISRYFFFSNLAQFGCTPRYFTMVSTYYTKYHWGFKRSLYITFIS